MMTQLLSWKNYVDFAKEILDIQDLPLEQPTWFSSKQEEAQTVIRKYIGSNICYYPETITKFNSLKPQWRLELHKALVHEINFLETHFGKDSDINQRVMDCIKANSYSIGGYSQSANPLSQEQVNILMGTYWTPCPAAHSCLENLDWISTSLDGPTHYESYYYDALPDDVTFFVEQIHIIPSNSGVDIKDVPQATGATKRFEIGVKINPASVGVSFTDDGLLIKGAGLEDFSNTDSITFDVGLDQKIQAFLQLDPASTGATIGPKGLLITGATSVNFESPNNSITIAEDVPNNKVSFDVAIGQGGSMGGFNALLNHVDGLVVDFDGSWFTLSSDTVVFNLARNPQSGDNISGLTNDTTGLKANVDDHSIEIGDIPNVTTNVLKLKLQPESGLEVGGAGEGVRVKLKDPKYNPGQMLEITDDGEGYLQAVAGSGLKVTDEAGITTTSVDVPGLLDNPTDNTLTTKQTPNGFTILAVNTDAIQAILPSTQYANDAYIDTESDPTKWQFGLARNGINGGKDQNTLLTFPNATDTIAGMMSAADKAKLDNINSEITGNVLTAITPNLSGDVGTIVTLTQANVIAGDIVVGALVFNPVGGISGYIGTVLTTTPNLTVRIMQTPISGTFNIYGPYDTLDDVPSPYFTDGIYLIGTSTPFSEYIRITDNTAWELIGSTDVDLSDYYTKEESDANYQSKLTLPSSNEMCQGPSGTSSSDRSLSLNYTQRNLITGALENTSVSIPLASSTIAGIITNADRLVMNRTPTKIVSTPYAATINGINYVGTNYTDTNNGDTGTDMNPIQSGIGILTTNALVGSIGTNITVSGNDLISYGGGLTTSSLVYNANSNGYIGTPYDMTGGPTSIVIKIIQTPTIVQKPILLNTDFSTKQINAVQVTGANLTAANYGLHVECTDDNQWIEFLNNGVWQAGVTTFTLPNPIPLYGNNVYRFLIIDNTQLNNPPTGDVLFAQSQSGTGGGVTSINGQTGDITLEIE